MDYLTYLVVVGCGDTVFFAVGANHAVYRVDFAFSALFEILQHACLKQAVLFDADGDECERKLFFQPVALIIEQLYNVLTLNRLDFYACGVKMFKSLKK